MSFHSLFSPVRERESEGRGTQQSIHARRSILYKLFVYFMLRSLPIVKEYVCVHVCTCVVCVVNIF